MKFFILLGALCLFQSFVVIAQPKFNFSEIKLKFPHEDAYVLNDKVEMNITIENDKPVIVSHISSDILLLNEKASMFTNKSLYYYDETEEIKDVEAASYIPQDNGKYKKVNVEKINTQKPLKDGIFYDDFKEIYFNFLSLKEGAVSSCSYTQKFKDPHFFDPFYFAYSFPVRSSECSVTFPKEVSLRYVTKGDTSLFQFAKKETKNAITYTWTANNLRSFRDEKEEGNSMRYCPHVIFYIDKYTSNTKEVPVLSSVNQLYKWYYGHISDLVNAPSDVNVKNLGDSITKGITDETEKIKKIYYWVQDNIKYIAFEEGLGGFVPRKADLICSRRFGDCKDKASLLYALFKSAGIKSYFTWIGTRSIPYSYYELPSPIVDNHMIVAINQKQQWYFLDGTEKGLNLGFPSSFIQGKEALISISPDSFVIVKVPAVDKSRNFKTDSLVLNIADNVLNGTGTSYFGGLWKRDVVNGLGDVPVNKQQEEFAKTFYYGNNKCKTDSISFVGMDDYSDSLAFRYRFSISEYVRKVDKKLFVNLHLKKFWQDAIVKDDRKTELIYNYKYVNTLISVLNIPKGYSVSQMPANSDFAGENFGFNITYKKEGQQIIVKRYVYFDELEKHSSEFQKWNDMVAKINDAYTDVVVLEAK